MVQQVKSVKQEYWRYDALPHIELRSTHQSHIGYKAHLHQALSVGAIEQGKTCVNYAGREYMASAGELVLIEPEAVHSCNPINGGSRSYHMLYLDTAWCLKRLSSLLSLPVERIYCNSFAIREPTLFAQYLTLVHQLQQGNVEQIPELLDRFTFTLFSRYCSSGASGEPEREVTLYMRQRLLENLLAPPSLSQLAEELSLRPETLIRIFFHDVGITPKAFVNNLRIEYAKQLLRQGEDIVDVAQSTGFSDQSHFHKLFVSNTAATPGQYQLSRSISDNH
ncbi:AraC family transcriptional regulator [Budviciaceae bacterium BWR-B9]|uniref:AraC family transcriptional regulator n=2 Tax=Budviciaceae TaxID=1903416 RepID=A0ABS1IVC5_9GAMM|nr:AraC family transcriptional regulator [Limnobaculum allomyrinae]MBV7693738.1 AraC family transcriptional regulator [Limnobaculum sp. M2-1]